MMKRILFISAVVMLMLGFAAPRAFADEPNRLSQLNISVWPEHDTPSVLVIVDGRLADAANLPRQVSVTIPSTAKVHVATYAGSDGNLAREQPTQTSDLGDGSQRVSFSVPVPNFWLEYYDDALKGTPDKIFDFVFKAPAPADQVTLEIEQPLKATNFTVTPSANSTRNADGFTFHRSSLSNVSTGQVIQAQIKYTKTDPNPSVQAAPAPASVPATTPVTTTSSSSWSNVFIVVALVVLGVTAVVGFLLLQQQRSRSLAPVAAGNRHRRHVNRGARSASMGEGFCTQCGKALGREDNFCPKCGAPHKVV